MVNERAPSRIAAREVAPVGPPHPPIHKGGTDTWAKKMLLGTAFFVESDSEASSEKKQVVLSNSCNRFLVTGSWR